jgi:diketogulonate reductase-like aldo/keto reductase
MLLFFFGLPAAAGLLNSSTSLQRSGTDFQMPMIGLGTGFGSRITEETAYNQVRSFLQLGGRRIDSGFSYGNEEAVGRAIRDSGIPRDQLYIVGKVCNRASNGYEEARSQILLSLQRLQITYFDILMYHWPGIESGGNSQSTDPSCRNQNPALFNPRVCRQRVWQAIEEAYRAGQARLLGVSNMLERHLKDVLDVATVRPVINQIEWHPVWFQPSFLEWSNQQGIAIQSYSSMGAIDRTVGRWPVPIIQFPTIRRIATRLGVQPSQVLLRWTLQQGISVCPRSINQQHQALNLDIFGFILSTDDMHDISNMDFDRDIYGKSGADPARIP